MITVGRPRGRALAAVATTSGTAVLAAGVAFIVNILMARQLGPESRGHVAWALQWAYVVSPLLTLGVDRAALRGLRASTDRLSDVHVWALALVGALIALSLESFAAVMAVATAAVGACIALERGTGMARGSLKRFAWFQVCVQSWVLAASTVLFTVDATDQHLWLAVYAAPAPVLLVHSLWSEFTNRHALLRGRFSPTWRSLHYMIGGLGSLFAARIERLLLPALASPRQLGLYVSIATASEMLVWGARGLGESRVAGLVGVSLTRRRLAASAIRDLAVFFLIALPLGLAINFALVPLLGDAFSEAQVLIAPLCISSALWATYLQLSAAWLARGSGGQSMRLDVTAAVTTAIASLCAIPIFGALGAAIACAASYALMIAIAIALLPRSSDSRAEEYE